MCLLIHQPKGLSFGKGHLQDFLTHNPDGFGFMYGDGNKLHLQRAVGKTKTMVKMYYGLVAGRESVIHFRQATHGPVTADNAHPFLITPKIGMAHNGILSIGNPADAGKTDTYHLIKYFIRPVAQAHPDWLFDTQWAEMLGELIGDGNKLAFAHADGRIQLVNGSTGVQHMGAWFSNTYAWSAPNKLKSHIAGYGSGGWSGRWNDQDEENWQSNRPRQYCIATKCLKKPAEGSAWCEECKASLPPATNKVDFQLLALVGNTPLNTDTPPPQAEASPDVELGENEETEGEASPYQPSTPTVGAVLNYLITLYEREGSTGIAGWMSKFPRMAGIILMDWYEFDTVELAKDYVEQSLPMAVDHMQGIIESLSTEKSEATADSTDA